MLPVQTHANPFALLMHPEAVVQAMERSDRLNCLKRRICRPLDKPAPVPGEPSAEAESFDHAIDAEPEAEPVLTVAAEPQRIG